MEKTKICLIIFLKVYPKHEIPCYYCISCQTPYLGTRFAFAFLKMSVCCVFRVPVYVTATLTRDNIIQLCANTRLKLLYSFSLFWNGLVCLATFKKGTKSVEQNARVLSSMTGKRTGHGILLKIM